MLFFFDFLFVGGDFVMCLIWYVICELLLLLLVGILLFMVILSFGYFFIFS